MIAASSDPLFADWSSYLEDGNKVTSRSAKTVAARAQSLVEDWPVASAMVRAMLLATHGPRGLAFRSQYQADDAPDTSDAEKQTRRLIQLAINSRKPDIDAGGTMSWRRMSKLIDWFAIVMGDGFAVRVSRDGRSYWRVVHPFRVVNPPGKGNSETMQDGIEIGPAGPVALWVDPQRTSDFILPSSNPTRIPWVADDGTPNVVHRVRWQIPGSMRGLSSFAPVMLPARMLQGIEEAFVAAKRVQASIPLMLKSSDPEAARQQYRGSKLANLVLPKDGEVEFPSWRFDGADYREFTDVEIRSICAAWGIPWELVLGDHSAKSGASSRSMWQQFYVQADDWQQDQTEQVDGPIAESTVRDASVSGRLTLTDDWRRNMVGTWQGPPRVMPDPVKEADAAAKWDELGRSRSSAFADQGWDYGDETIQRGQDAMLEDAQEVDAEEEDTPEDDAEDDAEDASEIDGQPEDAPDPDKDAPAESARMRLADRIAERIEIARASAPVVNLHPTWQINAQMPDVPAPVVHVAGPVVNVPQQAAPAVQVAPAVVNVAGPVVNVPQQAAPVVNVPQQAPPVVNVAAPVVNVSPPPRGKQRATEQPDGSVILEDIG